MRKLIVILLFSCCFNNVSAADITISFVTPQPDEISGNSLGIHVSITSTFQVSSVIAFINDHQITLEYDGIQYYEGSLSLTGLPQAVPLQLTVTATDILTNQQSVSENILYILPPTINVIEPTSGVNGDASLAIKADCSGIENYTLNVKVNTSSNGLVFENNFNNAVDTVIHFLSGAGSGSVVFKVTDSWNQVVSVSRGFIIENNIYFSEVFTSPYSIYDFNYNKVLTGGGTGIITDLSSNTTTLMTGSYLDNGGLSFLTPYGAIFGQDLNNQPYEWYNNTLYPFGSDVFKTIQTSGQYATWVRTSAPNTTEINLRDLATHTDILIGGAAESSSTGVASNGVAVFEDGGYDIRKYNGVTSIPITSHPLGDFVNRFPKTDGNYAVYLEAESVDYTISMYDGQSNIQLGYIGSFPSQALTTISNYYQVKNKFVAYEKLADIGLLQVWLRDSTGTNAQVSIFGTSSTLEMLNPKGDIMFLHDGTRYLVKKGGLLPQDLGPAVGRAIYRDSSWYLIEGRYLYKILVDGYRTAANGNWNDPATWENGIVPPPNADVIILNNVTVNGNVTCNSLNIHLPGSITVLPGFNLTILH